MKLRKLALVLGITLAMWTGATGRIWAYDPTCVPGGVFTGPGISTALGCVPVKSNEFMEWLLPYLFGITGGISFVVMAYGFILMSTSSGDPKALQGAQETVTSAITGLLLSIFAVFILRLIAVNILHIPGLN